MLQELPLGSPTISGSDQPRHQERVTVATNTYSQDKNGRWSPNLSHDLVTNHAFPAEPPSYTCAHCGHNVDSALDLIHHVASKHKLKLCDNLSEPAQLPPPPPYPSYYPPLHFYPSSFPLRSAFPSPSMESYLQISDQNHSTDSIKMEVKEEEQKPAPRKVFQPFLDPDRDSERSRSAELSTGSFEADLEDEAMDGVEETLRAEDLSLRRRSKELDEQEKQEEEAVTSTSQDSLDLLKTHLRMNKLPAMEPSAIKTLMVKGRLDALLNPEVKF